MGVKVAVVGGGSTYTPELVEGFVTHAARLPVDELVLFDLVSDRLDVVGGWRAGCCPRSAGPAPSP